MAVKKYSKSKDGNKMLSKNFKVIEFACKDGSDEILIDDKLVEYLQEIRDWAGKPIVITSAYRNEKYNKKVGGVSGSYHTKGMAADIVISGKTPLEVAVLAESLGIKGIGCYNDDLFNHIDTRDTKFFWYDQDCKAANSFKGCGYEKGTYIVRPELLYVREGPGTAYDIKKYSSLSQNAKSQIYSITKTKANGYVCGMTCNVSEVRCNWGKTPSGWICLDYCYRSKAI